jgi:hypothetical protein
MGLLVCEVGKVLGSLLQQRCLLCKEQKNLLQ